MNSSFKILHQVYNNVSTEACYPAANVRGVVTALLLIFIFLSILGNLLICIIVYRRASMRSGINLLLANLAFSDLLLAITNFVLTLITFNEMKWDYGKGFCYFTGMLYYILHCEKVSVLLVISVDRFYIIVKRKDTITPNLAKRIIFVTWLVSVHLCILPVFGLGAYVFRCGDVQCILDVQTTASRAYLVLITTAVNIIPTVMFLIIYYAILRTVRRNSFRIQNHPPVIPTAMHRKGKLFIDYGYKTRTSTTILLMCFCLVLFTFPLAVANLEMAHTGKLDINTNLYLFLVWLSYGHGAVDPLIFYVRIKKFRETIADLLPDYVTLPNIIPIRKKRRVRPHVAYSVDRKETKLSIYQS